MATLVMNMKEKEEEDAEVEEDAEKNGVNYGGSMDTLHEAKMEHPTKRLHTRKKMSTVFYIVFRGRHSWRNRNRRMKEGERRFSIPLYDLLVVFQQQQVLYYDTDSVIYKWCPGQPMKMRWKEKYQLVAPSW